MAAMAVSPETMSNSLAFLQMDLVDPDFHRHALAHSKAMHAEISGCWMLPSPKGRCSGATPAALPARCRG